MKIILLVVSLTFAFALPEHKSISKGRIVGGVAGKNPVPYQVGLDISNGWFRQWWCGGVLIKPKIGLSVAHCFEEAEGAKVHLGSSKRAKGGKSYDITKQNWVMHEQYNGRTYANDIAMFWLPEAVQLSPSINIIPLGNAKPDEIGQISGWGKLKTEGPNPIDLMIATVKIISNKVCAEKMKITDKHICTDTDDHDISVCNGDSGGPLTVDKHLVGLASMGSKDCEKDSPSVFTRVCVYIDWINKKGDLHEKCEN